VAAHYAVPALFVILEVTEVELPPGPAHNATSNRSNSTASDRSTSAPPPPLPPVNISNLTHLESAAPFVIRAYRITAQVMSTASTVGSTPPPQKALLVSLEAAFNTSATLVEAPVEEEEGQEEEAGLGVSGGGGDRRYGSSCLDCAAGYWSRHAASLGSTDSPQCTPCAHGTYKELPGPERCELCPNGTFSHLTNATSVGSCQGCAPGKFVVHPPGASEGANCTKCAVGYFAEHPGSSTCRQCGAGSSARDQLGNEVLAGGGGARCLQCSLIVYPAKASHQPWMHPGVDCSWRCPINHFKWVRDQYVQECVECPEVVHREDALAVSYGSITTLDGLAFTCRCPIRFPILRVLVLADIAALTPYPVGAMCGGPAGWEDPRVPIPTTQDVVVSSVFEPLHRPVWCCNATCDKRCAECYIPHHPARDIPQCDSSSTWQPPPPLPGQFFYPDATSSTILPPPRTP